MPRTRKNHPPSLKAKVAVEAIKAHKTAAQIAQMFGVHPTQVGGWKKQALAGLPDIFGNGREQMRQQSDADKDELYKQIGQLKVELDWMLRNVLRVMRTSSGSSNPSVSVCSRTGPRETAALARNRSGSTGLRIIATKQSANSSLITVRSPANSAAKSRSDSLARRSIRISWNLFPASLGQSQGGVFCKILRSITLLSISFNHEMVSRVQG